MFKHLRSSFLGAIPTLILGLLLLFGCTTGQLGKKQAPTFKNGMVVCAHPEAAQAGIEILRKGGNAIDAAVAVQFALAVVYPEAGNIGGGGFMVYRSANGESNTLDFREKAPELATKNMYLDSLGNPIPGLSLTGYLAVGVPGSVAGMWEAHQKYGKLSWKTLLKPAIRLAKGGFKITNNQARSLNNHQINFRTENPKSNYLVKVNAWKVGDILTQEDLAKTLELIQENGKDGFYKGETANLIVDQMKKNSGIITMNDLKNYNAIWRKPLIGTYKGYKVIAMPPPSSGGVALLQILKMLEPYQLSKFRFHQAPAVQLITEAEKRAYADRAKYLGDPDFYHVPTTLLLDSSYLKSRMKNFSWNRATPSAEILAGKFDIKESEQTTHFSIVDRDGNAVSITTTLNGSYGSKVFVNGAGFLLNNEMDDFSMKPGVPNMYGLVGGVANAIEPKKRMLSSMTPTIIEKNGKLFMVVGSPGGSTIITTVFQTISNVIDYQMNIQKAVDEKRFHHQWLPDEIQEEAGTLNNSTKSTLIHKGYLIKDRAPIGRCDAILLNQWGYLEGGADPRGDDAKMGY
ncbi:MAG: gamma-glutamyltransferase [Sphingobacteriales bacterium]|nr:gamma-glutamyltransferase [Sphingobacteriales bacterium]